MPPSLADLTCVETHVKRACEALVNDGRRRLYAHGPFDAVVVDVRRRAHSVIHVILLSSSGGAERRFYLKTLNATAPSRAHKARQCETEYQLLQDLSRVFAASAHLGVVTPIACWPNDLTFLTEEFPGRNVEVVLRDHMRRFWSRQARRDASELCHRAGAWLATFQSHTGPAAADSVDVGELIAYCELRVEAIHASPHSLLSPTIGRLIMRHLWNLARSFSIDERQAVGRHNDFRPDNMLAGNDRLVVLDFTGFAYGPRLYDFMKFWMRLEYMAFGLMPLGSSIDGLKAAFAEGYGRPVDVESPMAQFMRIANLLDKMSALADPPPRSLPRRLLENQWHRHLLQQLTEIVESTR